MRSKLAMKEARKRMKKPEGAFKLIDLSELDAPDWMTRAYMNNRYLVMCDDSASVSVPVPCRLKKNKLVEIPCVKVMVQRHDDAVFPNHWAELQRIKNEIFGNEAWAVEYYPAQSSVSDKANIYWLYVFVDSIGPVPTQ